APPGVAVAPAPRDPGRRPDAAWNPRPTGAVKPDPTPIVVDRPTERLLRHPGPAGVAPHPPAVHVRLPAVRDPGRPPHPAVLGRVEPLAVPAQLAVAAEIVVGGALIRGRVLLGRRVLVVVTVSRIVVVARILLGEQGRSDEQCGEQDGLHEPASVTP